tara:strand:- start:17 stop:244 length:228 start_codon:yes stop_codon:yes gene_type:complete
MNTDKIEALLGNSEELALELEFLADQIEAQDRAIDWEDTDKGEDALEVIDALRDASEEIRIARDLAESALAQTNP